MLSTRDTVEPDQGRHFYVTVVVLPVVTSLFVLLRIGSRWSRLLGLDDLFLVTAMLLSVLVTVMDCNAVEHGFGRHAASLSKQQVQSTLKYFYLSQPFYKVGICCTKLSVLVLYNRIFATVKFRRVNYTVMGFVVAYSVAFLFVTVLQCIPVRKAWDKTIPGTCVSNLGQWMSFAVINLFSDFVIIAMPLPMIRQLQLPRNQKIGLCLVFMIGIFVCVASTARMVALSEGAKSTDPTWGSVNATSWTDIELNTAIICACLPVLKAPLSRLFPRIFPSAYSSQRTGEPGPVQYALSSIKASDDNLRSKARHFSKAFAEPMEHRRSDVRSHAHARNTSGRHVPSPFPLPDSESAEHIVPQDAAQDGTGEIEHGGIVKTTVLSVQFEDGYCSGASGSSTMSTASDEKVSEEA